MKNLPEHKKLVLFDGVCNLCNASVLYIIKHDKKDMFRFAPLQSEIGNAIVEEHGINTAKVDSIILYSKEKGIRHKSSAALRIAKELGFPRNLSAVFIVVPTFIRNWVYDLIARNRYKWYGKKDECMIPSPELQKKFIQ